MNWRAWVVVLLSLSAVTCKKKKVRYDDTQYMDTLEVVNKDHQAGYYNYFFVDDVLYTTYIPPKYRTEFRGEFIHHFSTSSQRIYEAVVVRETVEAWFRKERNNGSRCKIDELLTSAAGSFGDVGGTCRLEEEARQSLSDGTMDQEERALDDMESEHELSRRITLDELEAFLNVLPHLLHNLPTIPAEDVDSFLEFATDYLEGAPQVPTDHWERFVTTVTGCLADGAEVPPEHLDTFVRWVTSHLDALPAIPAELLENLLDEASNRSQALPLYPASRLEGIIPMPREHLRLAPQVHGLLLSNALSAPALADRPSTHHR